MTCPAPLRHARPRPDGRSSPVRRPGRSRRSLTLVGAGRGLFPIGAHMRRYYMRPDVAYVPFRDAPPVHWRLMWRMDGATGRIHAFAAAHDLVSPDA